MRISEADAKKMLGEKAFKQAKQQMRSQSQLTKKALAKAGGPTTDYQKKRLIEQGIEDKLITLFREVFEPDYTVKVQQRLIPKDDSGKMRLFAVDVYVEELKLAGELDGYRNHGLSLSGFKRDRIKDRLLMLQGIEVVRFYASEVSGANTTSKWQSLLSEISAIRIARERFFLGVAKHPASVIS